MFTDAYFPEFRIMWIMSHYALDLFCILSGFLIAGIIEKRYRETNKITFSDMLTFYKRRSFKILPMYYIVIAICLFLSNIGWYYPKDFSWKFLVFLQNLHRGDFHFLPHTHSLTIQEWFCLLFPLTILFLFKFLPKSEYNPILIGAFIWMAVGFVNRWIVHSHGVESWDIEIRKTILTRIDAVIYGVLFYFIQLHFSEFLKKNKLKLLLVSFTLYLLATYILAQKYSPFFNNVVYYSLVTFIVSFALPYFIHLKLPEQPQKIFTFIGLSSYSIYLIHLPLLYIIFDRIQATNKCESLLFLVGMLLLTNIVGMLFYIFVENPIMKLRDK
ncbi:acyltransferase family protein [Flavobacterium sangjuense]|nr:acyltransferase [Flavobacterium sangjuense]